MILRFALLAAAGWAGTAAAAERQPSWRDYAEAAGRERRCSRSQWPR